jgi:asparagine N-glycosylation enzyme membrane subunit Stt3
MTQSDSIRRIRFWLTVFIVGLVLSGITAFPLQTELDWFVSFLHRDSLRTVAESSGLLPWIERVHEGLSTTNAHYPFLAYGTDWLAFAHLVIAVAFLGPFIDPVRNKWIITFGLIACGGVIPLALIAGHIRGIPIAWRLIDSSFGVLGVIPLLLCRRLIVELEDKEAEGRIQIPNLRFD